VSRCLTLAIAGALALVGCGGSSVCGNGVAESGEQCDDGNTLDEDGCSSTCQQQETRDVQIIWTMITKEVAGFSETCTGVSAAKIRLDITGPMPSTRDVDCNYSQTTVRALAPGDYEVKGTLLDSMDRPLTRGLSTVAFVIPQAPTGSPVQATVDFAMDDFLRTDYQGDWFYKLSWAGALTCSTAVPPVLKTSIRLERDGQAIVSGKGVTIDGLTPTDCIEGEHAPAINKLPWGPADLIVTGLDASGTPRFRETFTTFIGAGIVNPALAYDVDSLAPDAGVADAGAPDAPITPDAAL
jgi:cysteine-rich repeat protein